jgi:hypothetical protein
MNNTDDSLSWHDATKLEILGEMEYYPVSHFLLPLIYFRMTRLLFPTLVLIMGWEYIESGLVYLFNSFFWYPNNEEHVPDNMLSDVTMGLSGVGIGILFCFSFDIPRPVITIFRKDQVLKLVKIHFQFLTTAVLTVLLEIYVGRKKDVPFGYLVFWLGTVALLIAYAFWNRNDPRWFMSYKSKRGKHFEASVVYKQYSLTRRRYILEEIYFIGTVFLVFASAYYRYKGLFVIMIIDAAALFLVLCLIVLPLRRFLVLESDLIRVRSSHKLLKD